MPLPITTRVLLLNEVIGHTSFRPYAHRAACHPKVRDIARVLKETLAADQSGVRHTPAYASDGRAANTLRRR
ncbi:hypothetical protein GCM10011609_79030 [Lentzea pudingi]|uniref:Uncharacterized protein n=1 Tax=Lentzea pudingi TaxID=1789439 RepID=A0ABQ2IU88_9PSEU|nr:hypothetical protein GCM10011609_79030 [Lentzea pudingi]